MIPEKNSYNPRRGYYLGRVKEVLGDGTVVIESE